MRFWRTIYVPYRLRGLYSEIDVEALDGGEVIKYATKENLGTQIRTYDDEKPLTLVITASVRA